MRVNVAHILFILFSLNATAQIGYENNNSAFNSEQKLVFSGLSFPAGVNGELFKNLKINYQFSDKNQIQLQHFYEKYGTHELTNSSILFKKYIDENLYLFAGPEAVYGINQENGLFESKQFNLYGGFGYEVNQKLLLEFGYQSSTYSKAQKTFENLSPNSVIFRASF